MGIPPLLRRAAAVAEVVVFCIFRAILCLLKKVLASKILNFLWMMDELRVKN
jgi:hypothetical protein